jgi:hypothetical protein
VPDIEHPDISFCVELVTTATLRMQAGSGRQVWLDYLSEILGPSNTSRENLSLLGGFAFGILAQEAEGESEWIQILFVYIQQYLSIVLNLSLEECDQLAHALSEVFTRYAEDIKPGLAKDSRPPYD